MTMAERVLPTNTQVPPHCWGDAHDGTGASGGPALYGVSAHRDLRSGRPSGYGIGDVTRSHDVALTPGARVSDAHARRHPIASSLTGRHRASSGLYVAAPTHIVAAVIPPSADSGTSFASRGGGGRLRRHTIGHHHVVVTLYIAPKALWLLHFSRPSLRHRSDGPRTGWEDCSSENRP
jgi:hypothetical protein